MDEINEQGAASSTEPSSAPVASVEEGKPIESGTPAVSTPSQDAPAASVPDAPVINSPTAEAGNVALNDSTSSKPAESAEASAGTEPVLTPEQKAAQEVVDAGAAPAGDATKGEFLPADGSEAVVGDHPAHDAVNALDRFMERVSNDFMSEGKALVAAIRAEITKLI